MSIKRFINKMELKVFGEDGRRMYLEILFLMLQNWHHMIMLESMF